VTIDLHLEYILYCYWERKGRKSE